MSSFTRILIVSPYADGKTWYLRDDFTYEIGALGSGRAVTALAGFGTDFATVPRLLWVILPKWGKYGNAAVIHDYLYYDQKIAGQPIQRKEADDVFLEAMGVLNVAAWQKFLLYWGVRLFGGIAWYLWPKKRALGYSKMAPALPDKSVEIPTGWQVKPSEWLKLIRSSGP